jgi:erythromycin esterase-like protein
MHRTIPIGLAAILLLIAVRTTDGAPEPTAAAVLARFVEATGGRAAHERITAEIVRGRFVLAQVGVEGSFTLTRAAPNRSRLVLEIPGMGTAEEGTDGEIAWQSGPGSVRALHDPERAEVILRAAFHFDLRLEELFAQIEIAAAEPVNGRPCHVVRCATPDGFSVTRWHDVESGLLLKQVIDGSGPLGRIASEIVYDDYRDVGGIRVAHRLRQASQGQTLEFTVEAVELDPVLPDDAFAVPAAVTAALALAPPQPAEVEWLRANVIPFDTVLAGNGFADLEPFRDVVGDARIVSLGESTHGSREIFQMKHRLLEFLVSEMGFTIFSIEANMPEAYRVNDFVARGEGDPADLITGMYFWTWRTEEVLDMVRWMRRFNETRPEGDARGVHFTGFDMQFPDVAQAEVADFAEEVNDPELTALVRALPAPLSAVGRIEPGFASATATFPAAAAAGRRVVFRGLIRTRGVDGWAGIWWRADGRDGPIAFDNMQARAPSGDTDWAPYEISLDVPADVVNVNFGCLLSGAGTAWFDALEIEVDGAPFAGSGDLFDLAFEEPQLRGFSMGSPGYDVAIVGDVAQQGRGSLRLASRPLPGLAAAAAATRDAVARLHRHLADKRGDYAGAGGAAAVDWAIQNARILEQYMEMTRGNFAARDAGMAENVRWILEQNPEAKIVLWAHNGHVSTQHPWMGAHLERWYGDGHLPVGFATARGTYTAIGEGSLGEHPLQPPPPTSIEAFFVATGRPRAILDLRRSAAGDWLHAPRPFRSIGALAQDQQFAEQDVTMLFDVLVYIEETTAAIQIGAR